MSHRIQPYLYLRKSTCLLALLLYNLNLFSQGNECGTALELKNISNYCSGAQAFNNSSATPSSTFTPSCWTSTGNDVWFRFTAVAFDLIATVNGKVSGSGTMLLPQIAIYEGDCANLFLTGCEAAQPLSNTVTLYKGKLKVGNEYYIRVSAASSNRGTFQLCINNYIQTPKPGQDCIDAVYLCNKRPISITSISGAGADQHEGAGTCLHTGLTTAESNSIWYTWEAKNNGTLTFSLRPGSPLDDVDFVLFEIPATGCKDKKAIRCSSAGGASPGDTSCRGETGLKMTSTDTAETAGCNPPNDKFVKYVTQVVGKTYALLIEGYSNPNGAIDLSFGGTAEFKGLQPGFTASASTVCLEEELTFTSTSTGSLSYSWDFGKDASPATATTEGPHHVTYSSAGNKTVVLTVTGDTTAGCTDLVSSTILVNSQPSSPAVTAPDSICSGNTTTLTGAAPGGTYQWYDVLTGGTPVHTGNSYTTPVLNTDKTYYVEVVSAACTSVVRTPVTIKVNTTPVSPVVTAPADICSGNTVTLTATAPGGPYIWYDVPTGGTPIHTGNSYTTPVLHADKTYYVEVTSAAACTSVTRTPVTVNVNTTPVSPVVSAPDSICSGNTAILTAITPVGTYIWYDVPTGGIPIHTGNSYTTPVLNTDMTYYVEVASAAACTSVARTPVTIKVNSTPVSPVVTAPAIICSGNAATLTATAPGGTYIWYNVPTAGTPVHTGDNYTTPVLHANKAYYVEVVSAAACTSVSRTAVTIPVAPLPVASISASSSSIFSGGQAQLNASGGATYSWSPPTGLSCTACPNPIAIPDTTTRYCVLVTDANACTDSTCLTLQVIPCDELFVPSAFSPNNDGHNELVCVRGNCILAFHFSIYNRWGERVFVSRDQQICWDGTYKGKLENTGVFVYNLNVILPSGEKIAKKGTISLIR